MKQTLRVATFLSFACAAIFAFSTASRAQQVDFAFGMGTIDAPAASQADNNHSPVSLTGGAYPSFSGDVLLHKRIGFQGELAWKASRAIYPGPEIPYRPLFWDFNALYAPKLASHTELELLGGIGAESTRFYVGTFCGAFSCSNFQSSNHFMGHFGAGLKLYPARNFFIRPEAHLYLVNNNLEFSSARAVRYGVSIGYTLR
ncbi:MAG TPA: hypothetical protein VEK84_16425 [Terriglobales bacterium]|nr:hypothetical protein [Terriglobales bacterium]